MTPQKRKVASGKIVADQVHYSECEEALETAKQIVITKILNSELLLTDYINSRKRFGLEFEDLKTNQIRLHSLQSTASAAKDNMHLSLVEARAARIHWDSFRRICKLSVDWKRIYPSAEDSINILLNIGYTRLAAMCSTAIEEAGMLPQIGLYHNYSGQSLAYDFMECFRVPFVDAIIISSLSRKQNVQIEKGDREFGKIITRLHRVYERYFMYHGHWEKLTNILHFEAVALRQVISATQMWVPYKFSWGHRTKSKKKI